MKAEIFKAIGQPTRLAIVELLSENEIQISEIARCVGVDTATMSRHLSLLRSHGIVTARRQGSKTLCTLTASLSGEFMACLDERISRTLDERKPR